MELMILKWKKGVRRGRLCIVHLFHTRTKGMNHTERDVLYNNNRNRQRSMTGVLDDRSLQGLR